MVARILKRHSLALGIDFGGTKINAGVVTTNGKLVGEIISIPTGAHRSCQEIISDLKTTISQATESANLLFSDI